MIKERSGNLEATDVVALYAALISTITLIWNIINGILEKMPRVNVRAGIYASVIGTPGIGVAQGSSGIKLSITNLSHFDINILEPLIELPERIDNHRFYGVYNSNNPIKYPINIGPRERF